MSNVGLWDGWHATAEPRPFGNTASYKLGAEWLKDCSLVEDWGCGGGWLTHFIPKDRYRGVDGSASPFAEVAADLTEYRSEVPGLFMRHVLEHNYEWAEILDNALTSFTERMFLVLFTPLSEGETHDTEWEDPPGVPNLSFALDDLLEPMVNAGVEADVEGLGNAISYGLRNPKRIGTETVFRIAR